MIPRSIQVLCITCRIIYWGPDWGLWAGGIRHIIRLSVCARTLVWTEGGRFSNIRSFCFTLWYHEELYAHCGLSCSFWKIKLLSYHHITDTAISRHRTSSASAELNQCQNKPLLVILCLGPIDSVNPVHVLGYLLLVSTPCQ